MLRYTLSIKLHQSVDKIEAIRKNLDERMALWLKTHKSKELTMLCYEPVFWCDNTVPCISPADALQQAIHYQHTEYGVWLVKKFGYECLKNSGSCCPVLHSAILTSNERVAQEVINAGNRLYKEYDVTTSDEEVYCVECRQDSFINQPGCESLSRFQTALHLACDSKEFSLSMIKLLMREGACPHCIDYDGITPIGILLNRLLMIENSSHDVDIRTDIFKAIFLVLAYLSRNQIIYYKNMYGAISELLERILTLSVAKAMCLSSQCCRVILSNLTKEVPKDQSFNQLAEQGLISYPVYRFLELSELS